LKGKLELSLLLWTN